MLSVDSVFRRPDGALLTNAEEAAHVIAELYDSLGVTAALKKMFWLKWLGIAGICLGIIFLVGALIALLASGDNGLVVFLAIVGVILLAAGIGMLIAAMRIVLPVTRTTRLTKLPWLVSLHPLNGRTIVVDEPGFLPYSRFEFPSTKKSFGDIQDLMDEIANLVRERPVLMDRMKSSRTDLEFDPLKGQEEVLIRDYLDELAEVFGNTDVKVVELPALENSSPVIGYVDQGIQNAPNVSVPRFFQGDVDDDTGQQIELLDSLSRRRAYPELDTGQLPDPDLQRPDDEGNAREFDDFFNVTRMQMDDMGATRNKGLVAEGLGEQLRTIGQASGSAMRNYYCRNCFTKDLSPSTTGSQGVQREIGQPTTSGDIRSSEEYKDKITQVEELIYSSRLLLQRICRECRRPASESKVCGSCQKDKTKEGTDIIGQFWHCLLCGYSWDAEIYVPQDYFPSTLKVKEEIVLPLWDILWSELAVEKVRIISEKEQEQRDNNNLEDNELEGMAREFAQDRRLLRTRLDDLRQTSITASSTLKGVITSFRDNQIINTDAATRYLNRANEYDNDHQTSIEQLRDYLTEQEDRVTRAVATRQGAKGKEDDKRSAMIDPSDELKLNGRLLFDYAVLVNPDTVELDGDPSSGGEAYLESEMEIQLDAPAAGSATEARPTMSPYARPGTAELSEDVAEDEEDEFGEDMEIEIVGNPAADPDVYLVLTTGGEPLSGMEVTVNEDEVGPTDANGRVQLTLLPEVTLLRLRISDAGHEQEFEAEIQL